MAAAAKQLGGNVEACSVCSDKVYPTDRFVIEKLVMHKNCFKCKHCDRKLSLTNFAAVNNTVYCKVHYLKLFKESGGKYDKAFGDGGFQKKTEGTYTPGQFKGLSALPSHVAGGGHAPQMSPVVANVRAKKAFEVSKLSADDDEDDDSLDLESPAQTVKPTSPADLDDAKPSVKDILKVYEASLRENSSAGSDAESPVSSPVHQAQKSPPLTGSAENRRKWLSGVSSQHIKTHAEVDDTPGGTVAERRAAYLAQVSESPSPASDPSKHKSSPPAQHEPLAAHRSSELPTESVAGNLANRMKWNENLGETHLHTHSEIDKTSLGTAAERKQAYLEKVSGSPGTSPSMSSPDEKKVAKSISEKIRAFSTQSPPSTSSPKQDVSPGRIDDKLHRFMEAAAGGQSSPSGEHASVGKIDDKLRAFEEVAKGTSHSSPSFDKATNDVPEVTEDLAHMDLHGDDEGGRQRTDALVQAPAPSKTDIGQLGAPIRSFNEGASGTLRRTPSWLRQQRALEEANKTESVPTKVDCEEEAKQEPTEAANSAVECDAPSTPAKLEGQTGEGVEVAAPPSGSIMKRAGSFKKDRTQTPAEKRVVRFGMAEIHELPSSPRSPDPTDVIRSASSGHSASKGSALAAYLKVMDSQARKRPFEGPADQPSSPTTTSHESPPSPPPPILSPGARSPTATHASLASEVAKEGVSLDAEPVVADMNGGELHTAELEATEQEETPNEAGETETIEE